MHSLLFSSELAIQTFCLRAHEGLDLLCFATAVAHRTPKKAELTPVSLHALILVVMRAIFSRSGRRIRPRKSGDTRQTEYFIISGK